MADLSWFLLSLLGRCVRDLLSDSSTQPLSSLKTSPGQWPACPRGGLSPAPIVWTLDANLRSMEGWGGEGARGLVPHLLSGSEVTGAAQARQSPTGILVPSRC